MTKPDHALALQDCNEPEHLVFNGISNLKACYLDVRQMHEECSQHTFDLTAKHEALRKAAQRVLNLKAVDGDSVIRREADAALRELLNQGEMK